MRRVCFAHRCKNMIPVCHSFCRSRHSRMIPRATMKRLIDTAKAGDVQAWAEAAGEAIQSIAIQEQV